MEKIYLKNTISLVRGILQNSIEKVFGVKEENVPLLPFSKTHDWDYQSAFANKLFNQFGKTRPEIIQKFPTIKQMIEVVKTNLLEEHSHMIKAVSVSEQNFLLILLQDSYLQSEVNFIRLHDMIIPKKENPETVVVDFSSPNIAKEMHVGHLRSTILGESICRILEFKGLVVKRVNHLGDWGTQFGMLIAHLIDSYPDYLNSTPNLKDLETFYKESKVRFDSDPEFKLKAQQYVVKLQSGNEDCLKAWKVLCDISREFYKLIYKRLDITIEEFGESFYNPVIPPMLKELEAKALIKEDQGAMCIFIPKKKVPLMVVKKDGGFNYDTTDLAAVKYRLESLKAQRVIYLTDVGQWPHFELVFEGAKLAGWYEPPKQKLEHMGFGIILGENGERMKTRGGKTVKLMELLDEGRDRARQQLIMRLKGGESEGENEDGLTKKSHLDESEIEHSAEILSIAAIKYFDMRLNRTQNYKFDFDNMLNQKGDTAVYLMYSYIRLCSIIKKSGFTKEELQSTEFVFTDEYEKILARHLVKFTETVESVVDELMINKLCEYLYSLSVKIAEAYHAYKINNNEHSKTRVLLIHVCKNTMAKCFQLLGIKTIEKI